MLELNAYNDRGVDVVRNRIKMFAQQKVTLPRGRHKIIILDEADSMTEAAQQALRRTMELYSSTTRFALVCNSSEKIIEPIQSRCAMLRYSKLSDVVFPAQGDMRQALNNLQSTFEGFSFVKSENVLRYAREIKVSCFDLNTSFRFVTSPILS